ncbi:MAG: hypothetical protein ACR2PX_00955 [Endozoicomonas sp.]|uniref:hypothetical protein n=1 Tax=Endozoicomonas sp. TaxID=1892382 RepID=UPI003D9B8875
MNPKIPFHNKEKNPVHIGAVTVPAGETRMVEAAYVLARADQQGRQPQSSESTEWSLEAFVKLKQDEEIKQLPELTDDQFAAVAEYYENNQPPKKLEKALPIEAGARAAQKEADDYVAALDAMSKEELQAELLVQAEDEGRLALAQAELSKRQSAEEGEE